MATKYSEWAPTGFDQKGAFLENRGDWIVCPVIRTRDSGSLEESNFAACLAMLDGEQEDIVEVHSFNHWANGSFEIILVHPDMQEVVEEIEASLENHPELDKKDFCEREEAEFQQSWQDWGWRDFIDALRREHDLTPTTVRRLQDAGHEIIGTLFQATADDTFHLRSESNSVSIHTRQAAENCTRGILADFLQQQRKRT